jgi:hypothetical protein
MPELKHVSALTKPALPGWIWKTATFPDDKRGDMSIEVKKDNSVAGTKVSNFRYYYNELRYVSA